MIDLNTRTRDLDVDLIWIKVPNSQGFIYFVSDTIVKSEARFRCVPLI